MEKILQRLQKLGLSGDEVADNLYWDAVELDEDAFSLWVAENDKKLRDVLGMDALMADASKEDKAFLKEYNDLRNNGLSIFKGDKKLSPNGKAMKTIDDFMGALGVGNGDYNDNDRAAFSNPSNASYWKNMPEEDRTLAALSLGYDSAEEMGRDIERVANGFQLQNQVEGYGPNNELQPISWFVSALKGAAAPRIKEAQLAGREITWQDVTGDLAELGLNFIPGVGLVGKGGKIVAKIPVASKVANTSLGSIAGQGAAMVADQVAVPGLTQVIDAGVLYNPNVLGTEASSLNPRSEFDLGKMAAQAGAIAGAKGTVKGAAMVGKNMLEQGMGNEVGGGLFRQGVKTFESIGEKTDDLIKRRQAMLDRKAELAKKRENVTIKGDRDIPGGTSSVDDLYNADNFRILTEEAERIARTNPERAAYQKAEVARKNDEGVLDQFHYFTRKAKEESDKLNKMIGENADPDVIDNQQFTVHEIANRIEKLKDEIDNGYLKDVFQLTPDEIDEAAKLYKTANEKGAKDIVQLPDGRFIYSDRVVDPFIKNRHFNGNEFYDNDVVADYVTMPDSRYVLQYPGSNYTAEVPLKTRPVIFSYDRLDLNPGNGTLELIDDGKIASRNPAVLEQIQKDELLRRKLDPSNTALKENTRDVLANIGFNALAREGVVGNVGDFDRKREQALWNSMMVKMRPLTANSKLSPEVRKKNADAILNVMQYGLDGIPTELYQGNPKVYHLIADNLGVKGWKHPSEENPGPVPTTSYSSSY